ncbi:SAM-dependent methyltransferase [Streptomyces cyaneochromogenes]|uniref:SAM-dependent methyltransferase n=2 Tax=Streptomyces cyaneochromogenes TaxID=2496836 RepID=A0A3Q9F234_9ACTN|nr:SAM-dependent methyltransferase [Streptomyces cyaneochromogenes]AZQ40970.1 SAM-dependent methyltransferase [Streptomyces cyaneochromogenes]
MNNYLLGGKDHYPADQEACERLLQVVPGARCVAESAHRFLLRVTSHLVREYGIRQFIVFGAGLPMAMSVHQVARSVDVRCRVVYADDDPLVLTHGRALWEDQRRTMVVRANPLQVGYLLCAPPVLRLIDIHLPVAVLLVSVLHTIPDRADPAGLLEQTARVLAPGSCVAASQLVSEDADVRRQADAVLQGAASGWWGRIRPRAEVESFFSTLRLLAPGQVDVSQWRPGSDRAASTGSPLWAEYGGVAQVR